MSLMLTAYQGRPAAEIEDRKGEVFTYWFTLVSVPLGWAVRLAKIDTGTGVVCTEYTVSNTRDNWWECSCADWKFRRRQRYQELGCKHILAARELKQFLSAMQGASP